ncbi:MAG: hypothetical protein KDC98_05725 [Planctomycetes bacterium]|nr:hypothetical protein [Planctomycetota bacterium]
MWLWALLGWLAVSCLAVFLHHRFQRSQARFSPEVAAFMLRFETILAERHPDVGFLGILPDQFACLLEVEGQETPVALQGAFRHEAAFPDAFPDFVGRLIEEIREVGLDRFEDLDFAFAAPQLLPQVRSQEWLAQKGCFGDSGLVHRRINDQLAVVYVVDDPNCMVFLCRAHLSRWRKSEQDIHNLALANLARLDPIQLDRLRSVSESVRVDVGDGYDAARVLLLDEAEGLLVAIPDRDVLWVGNEHLTDLETLMADTRGIADRASHPVSGDVFRVTAGQLEVVRAAERP